MYSFNSFTQQRHLGVLLVLACTVYTANAGLAAFKLANSDDDSKDTTDSSGVSCCVELLCILVVPLY